MSRTMVAARFVAQRRPRPIGSPVVRDRTASKRFPVQLDARPSPKILVSDRAFDTEQFLDRSWRALFKQAATVERGTCSSIVSSVIAYVVSQRTREIGIRSALGAKPLELTRMFLLQGLTLSGVGALVGVVVALGLGRVMSSLLFGVSPMDPAAYVAAVGIIVAAAALASYVPARRAARIDPIETLRAE